MKPTTQLSPKQTQTFPLVDYHYQPAHELARAGTKEKRGTHSTRSIWKLSSGFFGVEARLDFAVEFALFTLILAVSAWPIFWSAVAVVRMMRGW